MSMRLSSRLFSSLSSGRFSNFRHSTNGKSFLLKQPETVAIVGAPLQHGQPLAGVDMGPTIIRQSGLVQKLQRDGWVVEDTGDIDVKTEEKQPAHPNLKFVSTVASATERLAQKTYELASEGKFVVTLGGDHSIAIGSIAGILKAEPSTGVVWVDAHADLNSPCSSSSGNIHGMVLSFLMDLKNARDVAGFEWMTKDEIPVLNHSRLVYIGLRDIDGPEKQMIRNLGIKAFTIQDVDRYGVGKVMEMAIDHLSPRPSTPRPIHLSFDIDAIDPTFAPSTGTRVLGGLSYREAYYIAESIAETGLLKSMDIVEVNPMLGDGQLSGHMTAQMATGLVGSACGNTIL